LIIIIASRYMQNMAQRESKYPVHEEIAVPYKKAVSLNNSGKYKSARRELLELVEMYPDEPRILNSLGNTYARLKDDVEKGIECYLKALEIAPDFTPALVNLASLYSALGRYSGAVMYARRALTLDRKSPAAWNTIGLYYARTGDVPTALDYFLASYSYDNDYVIAAFNAACALTELGRLEEALKYLEISLVDKRLLEDATTDSSLEALRTLPEFKAILDKAKKTATAGDARRNTAGFSGD
jgi:tetratricopeptide (TPR) repeat protein